MDISARENYGQVGHCCRVVRESRDEENRKGEGEKDNKRGEIESTYPFFIGVRFGLVLAISGSLPARTGTKEGSKHHFVGLAEVVSYRIVPFPLVSSRLDAGQRRSLLSCDSIIPESCHGEI